MTESSSTDRKGRTTTKPGQAIFVTGSTMRHVIVMTAAGSVGLMAIFLVDFFNLFYISLLGEQELAAAIGYAGSVVAFNIAIGIGMSISASALVSRALGANDLDRARCLSASSLVFVAIVMGVLAICTWPLLPQILDLLGATGRTKDIAVGYLQIVIPSMPLLGIGMVLAGLLRAIGDARRAMYITLAAGFASAILDPILIFGFDLGVNGAAYATIGSRSVLCIVGYHGAFVVHQMVGTLRPSHFFADVRALSGIAVPAVLTNVATPFGNAYVTATFSSFGDDAVAGWAIVGRIIPVAFGTLFALSGAVGPIIGQNFGAQRLDRVRKTLRDAMICVVAYTLFVWLILILIAETITSVFEATGQAESVVLIFCSIVAGTFVFSGALFVANAAFNNLNYPTYSTAFNWGRATLGTVPFVWVGAQMGGAEGALLGWALGGMIFGVAAVAVAFRVTRSLDTGPPSPQQPAYARPVVSPFSSGKGHL